MASDTAHTGGSGISCQSGSPAPVINQLVNLNNVPLERRDDVELLPETDVTYKDTFGPGGYGRYRTMLSGEIYDHRGRGRTCCDLNNNQIPRVPYEDFISLRLGK